jgi:signal transduction histidine kinase
VLDLASLESGTTKLKFEPFELSPIVKECISEFEPKAAEKSIQILYECKNDRVQLYGEGRSFKQILSNLLDNSIKFTNTNGQIRIRCSTESVDGKFIIEIEDSGIGISQEHLNYITKPFHHGTHGATIIKKYAGAGLGLALVHGLVIHHGGKIDIKSTPGVGTKVTLSFPLGICQNHEDPKPPCFVI